jgi:hypothetical protein
MPTPGPVFVIRLQVRNSVRPMHLFDPNCDSPGLWLVGTTKVYSGIGADIVMESISLIDF